MVLSHAMSIDSGILDTTVEAFDRHMAVNARANLQLIAAFARQVGEGGGAIVAMTSDAIVENVPYGASKGALDRIVLAAARELGHLGIRVNAVNPGPVDTGWMNDDIRAGVARRQPTGRLGTPADVAKLVAFLLSDEGAWTAARSSRPTAATPRRPDPRSSSPAAGPPTGPPAPRSLASASASSSRAQSRNPVTITGTTSSPPEAAAPMSRNRTANTAYPTTSTAIASGRRSPGRET